MPKPGEHKTVQARILEYAQDIGWTYVPRAEAEKRRGAALISTPQRLRNEPEQHRRILAISYITKFAPSIRNIRRLRAHWSASRSD
jgi:hypothetical protein